MASAVEEAAVEAAEAEAVETAEVSCFIVLITVPIGF